MSHPGAHTVASSRQPLLIVQRRRGGRAPPADALWRGGRRVS